MKIYVGYAIDDCAIPVVISTNKEKVKEYLMTSFDETWACYVSDYELPKDEIVVLD